MPTAELARWGVCLLLSALSLACAAANYNNLFDFTAASRARRIPKGSRVSGICFLGGASGAIACAIAPEPALHGWWWLPFLVDWPGTLCIGRGGDYEPPDTRNAEERAAADAAARAEEERAREAARVAREEYERRRAAMERSLVGCVLGTAVGDALGLACEGLSPRRRERMFPQADRYHLLPFGYGMCSDDTEHTVMLAQALWHGSAYAEDEDEARAVAADFAWRLRFWLLGLPAGIGLATLRAALKLWLFIPPRWSGVHSAGNGPAMRMALVGVFYGARPARLRAMVRALTRITHTDPKAEQAAWTVAQAAHLSAAGGGRAAPAELAADCRAALGPEAAEWLALLERVAASVERGEPTRQFAASLGLARGVSGYAFHSVPVALHAWLSHPADYRGAVLSAIECGGDADTVAAIVGGIAGAGTGREGIPAPWLEKLAEWPRTVGWMQKLAQGLAARAAAPERPAALGPVPAAGAAKVLLRNVFFMAVVLAHGFRRLLPPY